MSRVTEILINALRPEVVGHSIWVYLPFDYQIRRQVECTIHKIYPLCPKEFRVVQDFPFFESP